MFSLISSIAFFSHLNKHNMYALFLQLRNGHSFWVWKFHFPNVLAKNFFRQFSSAIAVAICLTTRLSDSYQSSRRQLHKWRPKFWHPLANQIKFSFWNSSALNWLPSWCASRDCFPSSTALRQIPCVLTPEMKAKLRDSPYPERDEISPPSWGSCDSPDQAEKWLTEAAVRFSNFAPFWGMHPAEINMKQRFGAAENRLFRPPLCFSRSLSDAGSAPISPSLLLKMKSRDARKPTAVRCPCWQLCSMHHSFEWKK